MSTYSISDLPIDCIINICHFLSTKDLVSFSKVCKTFYESSLVGSIWRRFSVSRWSFCDVTQVSQGPGRWRRYYIARRSVERHFDKGRPNDDYRVRTLRGHEAPITTVLTVSDVTDWDNPRPPMVISLCNDGKVKCWDPLEAKVLWSRDEGVVTAIAADHLTSQLASSCSTNATVDIWNLNNNFSLQKTLCSVPGKAIISLKYKHLAMSSLPTPILMGYIAATHPQLSSIQIWDPNGDVKPLVQLEVPPYSGMLSKDILQVSRNGLLAIINTDTILVWNLGILTPQESPVPPHTTVHGDSTVTITCWLHDNCLATHCTQKIDIWDVNTAISATHKRAFQFQYRESNMYTPLRSIHTSQIFTCLCSSNQLLLAGDPNGNVHILDPTNGNCLQVFSKPPHVSMVTNICADGERVMSCSKDFSIRVYRWTQDNTNKLESLYTLLGGSVAHKKHDGFWKVLCTQSSCLGICGNQIKVYTFAVKLAETV